MTAVAYEEEKILKLVEILSFFLFLFPPQIGYLYNEARIINNIKAVNEEKFQKKKQNCKNIYYYQEVKKNLNPGTETIYSVLS